MSDKWKPPSCNDSSLDPTSEKPLESSQRKAGGFTRRSFLSGLGAASIAATAAPLLVSSAAVSAPAAEVETPAGPPGAMPVVLTINGKQYRLTLDPRTTLLDVLRENLQMTGHQEGLRSRPVWRLHGTRQWSASEFLPDALPSCIRAIRSPPSKVWLEDGKLHPVQEAFLEHDGFQCGYCTPGQIMSGAALLNEPVGPDDDSVREFMSGNLCRCGAYNNIVAAVQSGAPQSLSGS